MRGGGKGVGSAWDGRIEWKRWERRGLERRFGQEAKEERSRRELSLDRPIA